MPTFDRICAFCWKYCLTCSSGFLYRSNQRLHDLLVKAGDALSWAARGSSQAIGGFLLSLRSVSLAFASHELHSAKEEVSSSQQLREKSRGHHPLWMDCSHQPPPLGGEGGEWWVTLNKLRFFSFLSCPEFPLSSEASNDPQAQDYTNMLFDGPKSIDVGADKSLVGFSVASHEADMVGSGSNHKNLQRQSCWETRHFAPSL